MSSGLEEVRLLTGMIREHQQAIVDLGDKRRTVVERLRKDRVTYREIAEHMGVTEQTVMKIARGKA